MVDDNASPGAGSNLLIVAEIFFNQTTLNHECLTAFSISAQLAQIQLLPEGHQAS